MNDKDDKQNDPMPDTRTPGNRSEKILVVFSCINKFKKKFVIFTDNSHYIQSYRENIGN